MNRPARFLRLPGGGLFAFFLALGFFLLFLAPAPTTAEAPRGLAECAGIDDDPRRLECYDSLSGRRPRAEARPTESGEKASPPQGPQASYFSRLWELERETRRGKYTIAPHRSNYALPFTYNNSPNYTAVRQADPAKDLKRPEVKFQLSLKTKLWEDILGQDLDLWFGYTQLSFWQFYNFDDSSPFRETNYEPELLLNFRTDYALGEWKGRFFNLGFNHQSNGQSEPLSRSWNRIIASAGFERGNLALLLKGWYRIPEPAEEDDNPKMERYLGYGEVWGYYFWKGHRFGVMLRNNLDFHTNRGAVQAEWSFPILERVSGYVQYYNGFGESLLDYNYRVNRIGVGFMLRDWN
jgi:phospholipase A1